MKYGIAIFPSIEVQEYANNYRKRYDTHYSLIAPHVTVKSAFEATDEQVESIKETIADEVARISPFTLEFHRFSSFHPTNNVIYMAVKPSEELNQLHQKLNQGPLHHDQVYDFIPHLTIGQQMTNEELHDVLASLKMRRMKLKSAIEEVSLMRQEADGTWALEAKFKLGGK
jgi:2'-5' RNA ligase